MFDGWELEPPEDQRVSEALGKKVEWHDETSTIYVGWSPEPVPADWEDHEIEGPAVIHLQYYEDDATYPNGEAMPDALMLRVVIPSEYSVDRTTFTREYTVPEGAKALTGALFLLDLYRHYPNADGVARVTFFDQHNSPIVITDVLSRAEGVDHQRFNVSLVGVTRVRMVVSIFHAGGVERDGGLVAEIGLSNVRFTFE